MMFRMMTFMCNAFTMFFWMGNIINVYVYNVNKEKTTVITVSNDLLLKISTCIFYTVVRGLSVNQVDSVGDRMPRSCSQE